MPRGIYKRTPKIREAIRQARLGTHHKPESIKKMRAIQKAISASPAWRKKVSERTRTAMHSAPVRRKHLDGLRRARSKHGVNFKGGNGQIITSFIRKMAKILEPLGYIREYAVRTQRLSRLTNYKVDFALVEQKVAIECDGPSHRPWAQQEKDKKKTAILEKLGWKVIRVPHD